MLVDHALSRFSTDNLSCMIVRFDKHALLENQNNKDKAIGVEGDAATAAAAPGKVSEAEKIVNTTKAKIAAEGGPPAAVGISASNSGKGLDPVAVAAAAGGGLPEDAADKGFVPTVIEGSVEEEPAALVEEPASEGTPPAEQMQVDSQQNEVGRNTAAAPTSA